MTDKYPKLGEDRKKPNPIKDGTKGYGKPCIVCENPTVGEKFIQINYMRGDDETIRACHKCWKLKDEILAAYKRSIK